MFEINVLNIAHGGPNEARPMARYLACQVIKAAPVMAPDSTEAWDRNAARTEFQTVADGLMLAFAAVGENGYLAAVQEMLAQPERFDELADGLMLALEAAGQHAYVDALVSLRVAHAIGVEEIDGMQIRPDTELKLAHLLGVEPGAVPDVDVAGNLMAARTAEGVKVPGKWYHPSHPLAYVDLTFSASKAVSIAWAFAPPTERDAIFQAHIEAVQHILHRVEATIGIVRIGDGGRMGRDEKGHITWLLFHHGTARAVPGHAPDPGLHTHAVIPNVVLSRTSDRVGSLFTLKLHGKLPAMREAYQRRLVLNLNAIGFEAVYDAEKRTVRLDNVPDEIVDLFSKRTQQIEAAARKFLTQRGINFDGLTPEQRSNWMTKAAAATRRLGESSEGEPQTEDWRRQAREKGWSYKPALNLTRHHTQRQEMEWFDDHRGRRLSI